MAHFFKKQYLKQWLLKNVTFMHFCLSNEKTDHITALDFPCYIIDQFKLFYHN